MPYKMNGPSLYKDAATSSPFKQERTKRSELKNLKTVGKQVTGEMKAYKKAQVKAGKEAGDKEAVELARKTYKEDKKLFKAERKNSRTIVKNKYKK
tara:strand:- start:1166 stop:1453 length:288 start_codon:yes stop_codon:yes gene_type:complete